MEVWAPRRFCGTPSLFACRKPSRGARGFQAGQRGAFLPRRLLPSVPVADEGTPQLEATSFNRASDYSNGLADE